MGTDLPIRRFHCFLILSLGIPQSLAKLVLQSVFRAYSYDNWLPLITNLCLETDWFITDGELPDYTMKNVSQTETSLQLAFEIGCYGIWVHFGVQGDAFDSGDMILNISDLNPTWRHVNKRTRLDPLICVLELLVTKTIPKAIDPYNLASEITQY